MDEDVVQLVCFKYMLFMVIYITSITIYLQYALVCCLFFVNYKVVGYDVGLCCHILLICPAFGNGTCICGEIIWVGQTSGLAWTPWGSEL